MTTSLAPNALLAATGAAPTRAARPAAEDCVHCGFCLPHCPTYVSWGVEMDSPRGRIDLFRALADGRIRLDAEVVRHFDRCLGCLACTTACPSGVRYGEIVDEARVLIERQHRRPFRDRLHRALIFAVFPYPARLRFLAVLLFLWRASGLEWLSRRAGLVRFFSTRLAELEELAPPVSLRPLFEELPTHVEAQGGGRMRVGLLAGCVQRVFFPQVNAATLRVLAVEGCTVEVPARQGCCGALSAHAGREDEAREMVRALVERFETAPVDVVAVNAAGCGSHLKACARLFADDPAFAVRAAAFAGRVRDVTEIVAALEPRAERHPLTVRVAYHSSCHLGHAQGVHAPPREILRAIPGLELVELQDGEACCGSAGVYNLLEPQSAVEIGGRKAARVIESGAEVLASANPGCTLHIQRMLRARGLELTAAHPVEIVDWSIQGSAPVRSPHPGPASPGSSNGVSGRSRSRG
jgi:glycolate oxidase iron-sulfur subunit